MRNNSLDILKLMSSFFVIFIHVTFTGDFGIAVKSIASFAVPVFFICSGYFSYNAITNRDTDKLLKRSLSLLKILIAAMAVFALCELVLNGEHNFITVLSSLKTYIMFFVFNNFNDGFFIPLWFLPALIYVYFFFIIIIKLKLTGIIKLLPLLLVAPVIFYDVVLGYMGMTMSYIYMRNFLFQGIPFFAIGYLLYMYKEKRISNFVLTATALIGIAMIFAEIKLFARNGGFYIGSVLVSVALFKVFSGFNFSLNNEYISYILAEAPLYIYILHIPVNSFFCRFGLNNMNGYIYPIVVLIVTLAISIFACSVKFKWMNRKNKQLKSA